MTTSFGMRRYISALVGVLALFSLHQQARAEGLPKIAVTDLTYEEKVSSYFAYVDVKEHSGRDVFDDRRGSRQRDTIAAQGEITRIERGELHKFTGDIKGALLKSGAYRVMEGHPWSEQDTIKIYDVIDRIRRGAYPGADYVLFGSITDINSRNEAIPIQATNAVNFMLSMELVAEFSLINTKTFEVVAGFSAIGEGSDSRLINTPGAVVQLSSGRVMRDVSQSLSTNVLAEIESQFSPKGFQASPKPAGPGTLAPSNAPIVFH